MTNLHANRTNQSQPLVEEYSNVKLAFCQQNLLSSYIPPQKRGAATIVEIKRSADQGGKFKRLEIAGRKLVEPKHATILAVLLPGSSFVDQFPTAVRKLIYQTTSYQPVLLNIRIIQSKQFENH